MESYGFIITRHVNSEKTNKYWNKCVRCIRSFYPLKKIIIIDDNSNTDFIKADLEYSNIEIIQSEFPGRGELLPYYYYFKNQFFENAIIIHDSIFFHKRINFDKLLESKVNVLPLWHFKADQENVNNTLFISDKLTNKIEIQTKMLSNFYILGFNTQEWYGCFGVQSFINYNFLKYIEKKYNLFNLLNVVKNRKDRCCLERIFGAIFCTEENNLLKQKSLLGNISNNVNWKYSFDNYENDIKQKKISKPIVKVFTGR
jgi:hypothetical protein